MNDSIRNYLAVDLGASSGRVFACRLTDQKIEIEPIHRFENRPVRIGKTLYWNLPSLWESILEGIRKAQNQLPQGSIRSVGVDSWGVDFAFLGKDQELMGLPIHYRDAHTNGILEKAFKIVPRESIYKKTGLQILQINSLFQLFSIQKNKPSLIPSVNHFLMIPDLFHWLLSGKVCNEITDASTSQLIDPSTLQWSEEIVQEFGLPREMFGEIVQPGTTLGKITKEVATETGLDPEVTVVVPPTHDTASAVAAVPNKDSKLSDKPNWCYISSGTWSLMGVEVDAPVINELTESFNFTNEVGVNRSIRLLKNIAGLWLVQQCKAAWEKDGQSYSWEEIISMAESAESGRFLFDPDNPTLTAPTSMPDAICQLIEKSSGQSLSPADHSSILRACFDSLALRYKEVLGKLEQIVGCTIDSIYIVGGGSQNQLLCQITADVCQRDVYAGPAEATVIGNALVQGLADGAISSLDAGRQLVAEKMPPEHYSPRGAQSSLVTNWQKEVQNVFG